MQLFFQLVNYFVFFFFKNFSATLAVFPHFTTCITTSFLAPTSAFHCLFQHRFATGAEL